MIHTQANYYVKYNKRNNEPMHIFLSGSREAGISHLEKKICDAILKTLLGHCKDPEKPRVFLLGPIGI